MLNVLGNVPSSSIKLDTYQSIFFFKYISNGVHWRSQKIIIYSYTNISSVKEKITFRKNMMNMCFVSTQNGKYYHKLRLWRGKIHVHLTVPNIMVVRSYSWYIFFNGNKNFQTKGPTRFTKQTFNHKYYQILYQFFHVSSNWNLFMVLTPAVQPDLEISIFILFYLQTPKLDPSWIDLT